MPFTLTKGWWENITTTSELQATGLKGYSLAKAEEMLTKGASSCAVVSLYGYNVSCYGTGDMYCFITDDGSVGCSGEDDNSVDVGYDGITNN